ncbi:Galectin [Operophtera brumata]|uniref:Galectin n=1 Tax=Operophtera brumata TaxID=104452 RepID=A0A0L7KW63_OPEBR|nr:Galectin [Operophtera brumata]
MAAQPIYNPVALNGAHFCEFPHRVPFQRISHLTVDGDVMVQFIGWEGAQAPPQQMYMVSRQIQKCKK